MEIRVPNSTTCISPASPCQINLRDYSMEPWHPVILLIRVFDLDNPESTQPLALASSPWEKKLGDEKLIWLKYPVAEVVNWEGKGVADTGPLDLTRTSLALGSCMRNSSMVSGRPGSQNSAAPKLDRPETWYPAGGVKHRREGPPEGATDPAGGPPTRVGRGHETAGDMGTCAAAPLRLLPSGLSLVAPCRARVKPPPLRGPESMRGTRTRRWGAEARQRRAGAGDGRMATGLGLPHPKQVRGRVVYRRDGEWAKRKAKCGEDYATRN
jgi:hypothetical protein